MKKSKRIVIAKDTLAILEKGTYQNRIGTIISIKEQLEKALNGTVLYTPEVLMELIAPEPLNETNFNTTYLVNNLTTLEVVRV